MTHTQMPIVFNKSTINLNPTSKPIRSGIPLRIFDLLACGGFVLSNYQSDLLNDFVPGEELDIYSSIEELEEKIEYYLVVLNANYTFNGKYDCDNKPLYDLDANGEALFKIYDMNDLSKLYLTQIEEEKQQILKREKYLTIGPKCLGKHCEYKKTTMCKFCKVCMKEVLQDGTILEFIKKQ